jgi:SAM-dependent methyltransferase
MECRVCSEIADFAVMSFADPDPMERSAGMSSKGYRRVYYRCQGCHSFNSDLDHNAPLADIFNKNYYEHVDGETISGKFDRVMAMGPDESDNWQRVDRILSSVQRYQKQFGLVRSNVVLDVGAGTGVFLARLKRAAPEFSGIAVEPDDKACEHLESVLQAQVICDVMRPGLLKEKADLISFNRVMEHMPNPAEVLRVSVGSLSSGGVIYIEVPDILTFGLYGQKHPEFGSSHLTIFSPQGLQTLFEANELEVLEIQRMREPSGKLSLYALGCRRGDIQIW